MDVRGILAAWDGEPATVDERTYTRFAESGWNSFNGWAAEREFSETAAALARMIVGPIIETGVGGGFTTRRVVSALEAGDHGLVICYESDDQLRSALSNLEFFDGSRAAVLADEPTPGAEQFVEARMTILDSDLAYRFSEIELWAETAPSNSLLLLHDSGNGHPENSVWMQLRRTVEATGVKGVLLNNPRGSYLAIK